jgi:hypothetical protein
VDEQIVSRDEAVALLFKVNDIAEIILRIERLLRDDNGQEEEADES